MGAKAPIRLKSARFNEIFHREAGSNHLWHIKDKLGTPTLGAIVAYAHRVGLVE